MMTNGKTNIILFSKTWQIVVCARVCATKLWSKECSRTLLNILFSFSSENLVASLPQIIEELTCLICEPRHVVNERHWCLDFPWPHASTLPIFVTCFKVKAFHNHNSNDKVRRSTMLPCWAVGKGHSRFVCVWRSLPHSDVTTVTLPSSSDSTCHKNKIDIYIYI